MEKSRLKIITRWIAILPVGVLAYLLGGILANILFSVQRWFLGVSSDSGWAKIDYWILSSVASAAACVYFGSMIAPAHRKIVAMILAAVVVAVSAVILFASIIAHSNIIWTSLATLSSAITAGMVVYNFFEEDRNTISYQTPVNY